MGDIINLNKARKDKAKAQAKARAVENRVVKGQRKDERNLYREKLEQARRELDLHKLDKPQK
ncbi:MAG: DUF4169 family protein [Hyphomicrobiales bacterium]|nr:MAG: DUF4169 family protein [Hyphomicrobiales bacterium]